MNSVDWITKIYNIADFFVKIRYQSGGICYDGYIESFVPFLCHSVNVNMELLFTLTIEHNLDISDSSTLLATVDTGNGETIIYSQPDGGYDFVIKNLNGDQCCLLKVDSCFQECSCSLYGDYYMQRFGLNDALMLIFAFSSSYKNTLLMHASCVSCNGIAYAFIAKSGTGKSTHSALWMCHIPDVQLVNDDNPIVRIGDDGSVALYGSPWSGKTPCYRKIRLPLGAIVDISRGATNKILKLSAVPAFAKMLPACSTMKWDVTIYNNICNTITKIIESVPIYSLSCLPDKEAAELCHHTISKGQL